MLPLSAYRCALLDILALVPRTKALPAIAACSAMLVGISIGVTEARGAESTSPQLSKSEVETLAQRAQQFGTVEAVEAVRSSAAQAQVALDPEAEPNPSLTAPVDLAVMHGHFTYTIAKVPRHASAPTGRFMAFIVDPSTGTSAVTYVGDRQPSLSSLGTVELLTPTTSRVSTSRRHRTFKLRRRPHTRIQPRAQKATWGKNCKFSTYYHCYVTGWWVMTGSEQVEGTESEQKATAMNVPGWQYGYFVDNEEWAEFTGTERWTEIGQQAGEGKGCCNLWWFYAYSTGPGGYHQYTIPPYVWEVTYNSWNNYAMNALGNGVWCFDVGANWEIQEACFGGFDTYSKWLEDGVEVATEEKPANAGTVVVNAMWLGGTIKTWKKAEYEATTPGLCWSHYAPENYPGNINYATC